MWTEQFTKKSKSKYSDSFKTESQHRVLLPRFIFKHFKLLCSFKNTVKRASSFQRARGTEQPLQMNNERTKSAMPKRKHTIQLKVFPKGNK